MRFQRTIKKEVFFSGIGLHTGKVSTVHLKPAPKNTGIVFYRVDKQVFIKASIKSVVDTSFATTLGSKGIKIRTVEHLLSACAGLGIDNLFVEVDGPEIPILDGSSADLTSIILKAGIAKQDEKILYLKITKPIVYENAHSKVMGIPYDGWRITYLISFPHHKFGQQKLSLDLNEEVFMKEIAPARTFGFLKDVEKLKANGLAKGGSLDNAIVIGDNGIINTTGLRFNNEFVRHKILDSIGDLSLAGFPFQGHFILEKAGHTANINFLRKLLSSDCYTVTSEVDHFTHQVLNYI